MNELERLAPAGHVEAGPEHRVASDEPVQRLPERVEAERRPEREARDVDEVVGAVLAVEDEARLQARQGVGVLEVFGDPAAILFRQEAERAALRRRRTRRRSP